MRVPLALLAFGLALVPSLALAPALAQSSWHIDGTLVVQTTSKADLQYNIVGLRNTVLTLFAPEAGVLTEARDLDGKLLDATPMGDQVRVSIGNRGAIVHFQVTAQEGPPFVVFPAQLNGQGPSSMSLTLPSGWGIAAAVDRTAGSSPALPDAQGRFQREGGGFFFYVVTPPEVADPGRDLRVHGEGVLREANATVTDAGVRVEIDHAYDTGYYSSHWSVSVPENAQAIAVTTPFGPVPFTRGAGNVSFDAPYPNAFDLGGRPFTVAYDLPAPVLRAGPFREFNLSVAAGSDDTVTTRIVLPTDATFTGALTGDDVRIEPLAWRSVGPSFLSVRYLPAVAPGQARFVEGIFVVDAPADLEAAARVTARNASQLLPSVAAFLEPAAADKPFFVAYTHEPVFDWEEGFYANGVNTISIRASDLRNVTTEPDVGAVNTLVHEATHGLYDRQLGDAGENNSFLREGLSRLAEMHVEAYFPHQVPRCNPEATSCHPGVRLTAPTLHAFHKDGKTFPPSWSANDTASADRTVYYSYSGMVLRAFEERAPEGALPAALVNLSRTPIAPGDEAEAERIVSTLLAYAPGTSRTALLYPGKELAGFDLERFRACMGDLVAPPYPWERDDLVKNPSCPANGYGGSQATLPAAPPEVEPTPAPPTPSAIAPPPPSLQAPTTLPTTSTEAAVGDTGEVPAGRVDPTPGAEAPPIAIPGPTPALALALAAVALVVRRRA